MGKLTAAEVKGAKFTGKACKLTDGDGLYLLVNGAGKYWRYDFRFLKRRKTLAIGVYPDVSLQEARKRLLEARIKISEGIDPCELRKITKINKLESAENSFKEIALYWFEKQTWTEGHRRTVKMRLENNVYPFIGDKPVKDITAQDVLLICRRIEARGAIETAHRVKSICSQVMRYCVACGLIPNDPCRDLTNALTPVKVKHMASITDPGQIGVLLKSIEDYKGNEVTRLALQLAPLVFVRPGELRKAEWSEFDFEQALWKIPAEKMKMKSPHIVPLSTQALESLDILKLLTGSEKYVFPSIRTKSRPMSENTVNAALRRLGYTKEELTGHGFRSMFSTRFHEMGWPSHLIEKQLAHKEGNSVKAAYNFAEYLPIRKVMMQAWADYLDDLRNNGKANLEADYFYDNYQKNLARFDGVTGVSFSSL
jgi:integrase